MKELITYREISPRRTYLVVDQELFGGITHFGRLDYPTAESPLPRHTHPSVMEMCYVERGSPVFTADFKTFHLRSGQCFICPSGLAHGSGQYPLDKMKMYWIGYNPRSLGDSIYREGPEAEKARFLSSIGWNRPMIFQGNREMGRIIDTLIDLTLNETPYRHLRIQEYTLRLFHLIGNSEKSRRPESGPIQEVCLYIREHAGEKLVLEDLAGRINLSESRFKARFREETGFPPGEYILRLRVEEAQKLLLTGRGVTDTAFDLGFSSSQYFSTVFRRFTSLAPTRWLAEQEQPEME